LDPLGHNSRVGPNLPFGGLACGLVLGPLPSVMSLFPHWRSFNKY